MMPPRAACESPPLPPPPALPPVSMAAILAIVLGRSCSTFSVVPAMLVAPGFGVITVVVVTIWVVVWPFESVVVSGMLTVKVRGAVE